jgi:hypothetical protein
MLLNRRSGAAFGALFLLVFASCTDSAVVGPETQSGPALAILDGDHGGSADFFFLPPFVDDVPQIVGDLNPDLSPAVRVCELTGEPGTECADKDPIAYFPPGSIGVGQHGYQLSWNTNGPETGEIHGVKYYRLEVLVVDSVMGWIELDPHADGHGSTADAYAFRVGDIIPVSFWLSTEVLCNGEAFVTECITGAVIDETGGNLSLEGEGNKLGVIIFEGGLPGENSPPITVTVERIDPDLFFAETGAKCLPLFDAPQFGDCFRVRTFPELTAPLDIPALVSICLDPTLLDGIDLPAEQENQLTMVRFNDDGTDQWEALPDAAGDCPVQTASLLRIPDAGLLRYAAMGINAVADFMAPEPLAARDIRLGGLTSSFSRFRYALPGQMIPTDGAGVVLQPSDGDTVSVTVNVVDQAGLPVENAIVHFETSDGTTSASESISDIDGDATVAWIVDRSTPGERTLTASALGLLADTVPEHSAAYFFTAESVDITVTVVGPPAAITQSPTDNLSGTAGTSAGNLTVDVVDAAGNPVAGAPVLWDGDGEVTGGTETGADGSATGEWTLPTLAGESSITATVGTQSATFTATTSPGAAATLFQSGGGAAPAGSTITLTVTVSDAFGNVREGDAVAWSVTTGGGSIAGDLATGVDGTASAGWTLGPTPGENSVTAMVEGLQAIFDATGECTVGYGTAAVDGVFGAEWACANSLDFEANIYRGRAPATVYWMNDGTDLFFAVRVPQESMGKTNSLRLDLDNDGDGMAAVGDDVIGYDAVHMTAVDQYLTRRCVRRRQSSCGRDDISLDVDASVSNDGTYTTYELSHPLGGDPNGEDLNRTAGDALGFFLTLHIGRGAKGNTQVPGFREYQLITIAEVSNQGSLDDPPQ